MNEMRRAIAAFLFGVLMVPGSAWAQGRSCAPKGSNDLLALDLDSLFNVKVITASKSSEAVSDAPGMISVVTSDELRRFASLTLKEVLERVPGLSGTSAYFTDRSLVAAHGDQTKIDGGHMLILINGRPSREILEGGVVSDLLESFPVTALERVEVVKGPGSVLYGSNAFSAVINLITIKPETSGYSFTGLPTGSAGLVAGQGAYRCGDFSLTGTAQYHRKPDWQTTYRYTAFDPNAPPVPSEQQITIPDRSTGAFVNANYKALSVMSSFTEWQTSAFVRGTVGENRWKRGFVDAGYGLKPRAGWDMNVNVTYTRNTFNIEQFPDIARDSSEIVLEWTNWLAPTKRDRLTFGTLYNYIQGHETYYGLGFPIPISDGTRSSGSWYAQMDHRLAETVKLVGGFQANKIGNLDLDVVPRAGVVWNPVPHYSIKALYSQAFRAPSINETRLNHPGLAGNPDLRPEHVGTFDLGVTYRASAVEAGVSYYHSKQTNSIIVDTGTPRWRYANLKSDVTFEGVELETKVYFKKDLFLQGSVMHQTNENTRGMVNVTPIANTNVKAGVSYDAPQGVSAGLFDTYEGGIPGYLFTVNPPATSHHVLNANVRVDLARYLSASAMKGMSFIVNVENLTDRRVWLPDLGGNTNDTIPSIRGRTIYFGVELSSNKGSRGLRGDTSSPGTPATAARSN